MQALLRLADQPPPGLPPSKTAEMHFAMPRFDSFVDPLTVIFRNLKPILAALADEESDEKSPARSWATELLDTVFTYGNLVSLALVVDIWLAARDWVHARDQRKRGTFGSICITKRLNNAFLKDLHTLIEQEKPLALAQGTLRSRSSFYFPGVVSFFYLAATFRRRR